MATKMNKSLPKLLFLCFPLSHISDGWTLNGTVQVSGYVFLNSRNTHSLLQESYQAHSWVKCLQLTTSFGISQDLTQTIQLKCASSCPCKPFTCLILLFSFRSLPWLLVKPRFDFKVLFLTLKTQDEALDICLEDYTRILLYFPWFIIWLSWNQTVLHLRMGSVSPGADISNSSSRLVYSHRLPYRLWRQVCTCSFSHFRLDAENGTNELHPESAISLHRL